MSNNTEIIRIDKVDKDRLNKEVKQEFLKHNKKHIGLNLPYRFLVKKTIDHYLEN